AIIARRPARAHPRPPGPGSAASPRSRSPLVHVPDRRLSTLANVVCPGSRSSFVRAPDLRLSRRPIFLCPGARAGVTIVADTDQESTMTARAPHAHAKASFNWEDPLLLDAQLTEDERMVREAAAAYCQGRLAPRVLEAFRHEKTDPTIFREMGELGL